MLLHYGAGFNLHTVENYTINTFTVHILFHMLTTSAQFNYIKFFNLVLF